MPVQTAPEIEQTQALPTCVVLGWQLAVTATGAELVVPQAFVAVAMQVVLPAFVAGKAPDPLAAGTKLPESGLSPVQLMVAVMAPEPEIAQVTVWEPVPTTTLAGVMVKVPKEGGKPQLVALATWPIGQTQAEPSQDWPEIGQTHENPSHVRPPVQMLWQVEPFQVVPPGQFAETDTTAELTTPQALLAVAWQLVTPWLVAAKAPAPPAGGTKA